MGSDSVHWRHAARASACASGLQAQMKMDMESLQKAIGRDLGTVERAEIEAAQLKSYRWTFLLSGMTHPNVDRSLRELSTEGHRRVGELARAIA